MGEEGGRGVGQGEEREGEGPKEGGRLVEKIDEQAEFLKILAMPDPRCRRAARQMAELRRLQAQWGRDNAATRASKEKARKNGGKPHAEGVGQ